MILLFVRNLGIVFCCIYTFHRIQNFKVNRHTLFYNIILGIIILLFSTLTENKSPYLTFPLIIVFTSIIFTLYYKLPFLLSFTSSCFAYAISYLCFAIAASLISLFIIVTTKLGYNLPIQILTLFLQFIINHFIFSIRRIKNGMPFLTKQKYLVPGILISIPILSISTVMNVSNQNRIFAYIFLSIFVLASLFYIYWQSALTKTYIDELTKRTIENLNEQLADKDKAYETLLADKERLSEIVHADKKLVSALEVAVVNRLESTEESPEKDKELLDEIRRFSRERKGSIAVTEKYLNPLPSCGIIAIDNVLSYMYQKASPMGIHITVAIDCDVKKASETLININDFSTLLADMLDNALIATKLNQGKHVLVSFSIVKKHFVVQVSDSGIPFTKEVLYKMGKEQVTTHANEEGNGIGLMKTFEILNKVNASLFIEEYDQTNGLYTKTLSVAFNGKKQYVLYTTRDEMEIAYLYQRPDITVIHK